MPMLSVNLEADGKYPDCTQLGDVTSVGLLRQGMQSGAGSVIVEIKLPDGTKHYGQTSLALLCNAAAAMKTRDDMNQQAVSQSH